MSEETAVPDLYRLAFMPGCFRCPKCGFILSKVCMNPNLEVLGTREQDRESEPCPNDGTMMVHVTYREQLEVYADRLREEFQRIEVLKKALLRNRTGYLNILEMRKLSHEVWGGHGDRYGALTREEIEAVLADIDEALKCCT